MEPLESRSDIRAKLIAATPCEVFAAMRDPARVAKWWGPAEFTNTIHKYEFAPGGSWLLTMHGPDGHDYPNESRFTRIVPDQLLEIEHLNGHHFVLTLELLPHAEGTKVLWRQTFDSVEHYKRLATVVAAANEQNLQRLAIEAVQGRDQVMPNVTSEVTTEVLQAFAEAWNRHDIDALMSFMCDDCLFEASGGPDICGTRYAGREAVRAGFAEVWAMFPDAHWGNARHLVHGDRGVSEWTFTGTRADGTRLEVHGCDLFTFRDGKIALKDSYRKNRPALGSAKR